MPFLTRATTLALAAGSPQLRARDSRRRHARLQLDRRRLAEGAAPPAGPFRHLAVGHYGFACGILESDESIVCWSASLVTPGADLAGVRFTQIAGCNEDVCAVTSDGEVAVLDLDADLLRPRAWLAGR